MSSRIDAKIVVTLSPQQCDEAHRLYARRLLEESGEKVKGEVAFLSASGATFLKDSVPIPAPFDCVVVQVER